MKGSGTIASAEPCQPTLAIFPDFVGPLEVPFDDREPLDEIPDCVVARSTYIEAREA